MALVRNVGWIHDAKDLADYAVLNREPLDIILETLFQALMSGEGQMSYTCLDVDRQLGLPAGSCLLLVKHQIANRRWHVSMNVVIATDQPIRFHASPVEPAVGLQRVVG